MTEGMQEHGISLAAIIDEYFVEVPPCNSEIYDQCVCMGCTAEVDVSCVEGEWHMRPLCLNHGSGEGYMVYPLIAVFFIVWFRSWSRTLR